MKIGLKSLIVVFLVILFSTAVIGRTAGPVEEYATAEAFCANFSAEKCVSEETRDLQFGDLTFNCVYSKSEDKCVPDVEPPAGYYKNSYNYGDVLPLILILIVIGIVILFEIFKAKVKNVKYLYLAKFLISGFLIFGFLAPQIIQVNILLFLSWVVAFLLQPLISVAGIFLTKTEDKKITKLLAKIILVLEVFLIIVILPIILIYV